MGCQAASAPKRKSPRTVRYRNGAGVSRSPISATLDGANARGLWALGALADLELDLLVLFKGAEAAALNFRVVDENIRGPVLRGDKAEALLPVEPLHSSLRHLPGFP